MTIRVTEPGEWAGHLLEVLSRSLPASAPLRSVGTLVRFKIAKVYLVHEYPRNDGRTDHYVPGDGALENLEILKKEPN